MRKKTAISLLFATAIAMTIIFPPASAAAQEKAASRVLVKAPHRVIRYPRVGLQVNVVPSGYRTVRVGRQSYRYYNGAFYRPRSNGVYVVVRAPIGARVRTLPPGYVSFGIGPHRYFYANYTYYLWDRDKTEYVVVEEPEGAEAALAPASEATLSEIFVYPNDGQSDEQRDRDEYECHLWAAEQTGYDPITSSDADNANNYRRALSACLEGRGYTVK